MKEVKELNKKILELWSNYQQKDARHLLEILELEIKICKLDLDILEFQKPYWFQKKKLKLYQASKEKLEERIARLQTKLHQELENLSNDCDK